MAPVFEIFHLFSYFMEHHDLIDPPLSAEKISLSPSHLVPEILRPKVGHQNVDSLYLIGPLFHSFYIFLKPHYYKTLDPIGSIFYRMLSPPLRIFVEVFRKH